MTEQEFFEKMAEVWMELHTQRQAAKDITEQMTALQEQGMSNATIHIRSDNDAMELLHPTGSSYEVSNGRRREYVGKKPEAQELARSRVQRFADHQTLGGQLHKTREKIRDIERQIERLHMAAKGGQAKLFSEMGTALPGGRRQPVPKDWNWLSPQMVIDYFSQSPDLVEMYEDVKAVLGKLVRVENKKAA